MQKKGSNLSFIGKMYLLGVISFILVVLILGINLLIEVNTARPFLPWNAFDQQLHYFGLTIICLVGILGAVGYVIRADVWKDGKN